MITKLKFLCLLVFTMTLMLSGEINSQNLVSVAGLVIDDEGKPVSKAIATLFTLPCEKCPDHINVSYTTNEDGVFFLDTKAKKAKLLIEGPIPDGLWNPIAPADLTLERFPEFQGIILEDIESSQTVQLGEVAPHLKYEAVSIDLLKLFNVDKTFLENGSSLRISIEYKGVRVANDLLVQRAIDLTESKVKFALPQGKWELIFEITKGNQSKSGRVTVDLKSDDQVVYNYGNECAEREKSPKYKIAFISEGEILTLRIIVEPEHQTDENLILLAKYLKKKYCTEKTIIATVFDNKADARDFTVYEVNRIPDTLRAIYSLDRNNQKEQLERISLIGNKQKETPIKLN